MPCSSNGFAPPSSGRTEEKTHYDVLEIQDPDNCRLSDIKKAYRRLALRYHPDRVPPEQKEESTIKFREVSEAYEVLSDEKSRAEYDYSLKYGGGGGGSGGSSGANMHRPNHYSDPFSQFNDLFRNDPFFSESFRDMDDLFAETFRNQKAANTAGKKETAKKGWGGWLLDCLGVQVSTTSTYVNADGTTTSSSYGRSSGTYTSKSSRTIIENGRRITIQSMEKDGNRIEERYEGDKLVQRLINGRPQNAGRIGAHDL
eukprot:CAMPEP_0172377788 /NCGR_PEP_ID=MMETSP1060-20121228/69091_1 /TAXON_ID=37318 /ORGANISM="Pseudo-nitzschia pungens, Strain cf. cingulata" /LENGTH=256 /DNA_ID=CAMNT_0013105497 /DNA_START=156 /DNA_END=926 /DNA_ORIENTATION=+